MTRQELVDLLEREGKGVYSFCRMLTGDREEAEELYQETWLAAMKRLEDIDMKKNPKSYLLAVSVGIYKNNRKKAARRARIAPVGELTEELASVLAGQGRSPEEELLHHELKEIVRKETRALPEHLRLPVYLYYTAELSVEEIAQTMHIPKGTVKSRLHKARMIIKKKLEDYGYDEGREDRPVDAGKSYFGCSTGYRAE